jgi:hypothetical protein
MDDVPGALERLTTRLEMIERRVYDLEHPSDGLGAVDAEVAGPAQVARARTEVSIAPAAGVFPVLGRAMLGMAGAYVLRAVAESGSLPRLGVAALAFLYAITWLVWATRTHAGAWFASTTYACTSAFILAPMLWELTLSSKVLPGAATAGALGAWVCAAWALAWKRNSASVLWTANMTAATLSMIFLVSTHQVTPFIGTLLLMALICEYAASRNRDFGVRVLVAAVADLAVWALIFIYSSPQSTHKDYPGIDSATLLAPGCGLFLLYGVSTIFKTSMGRKRISIFETIQTMIAFLLAGASLLYFGPASSAAVLGIACLVLSAATYTAAFALFDQAAQKRNFLVFSTWSAALYLAGCRLCLPPLWMAVFLCAAAVAATVLGVRLSRRSLEFHGMVYLLAGAAASGLLNYVFGVLGGTLPARFDWEIPAASASAAICYAAGISRRTESWKQQFIDLFFAMLAVGAGAALLVQGIVGLTSFWVNPGTHHLAFVRTLILCVAALALAFSGSRWRRVELTRIGYATLALVAAKLVFEDLRLGHLEFIAAGIFLFAVTLIAVPRLARLEQSE